MKLLGPNWTMFYIIGNRKSLCHFYQRMVHNRLPTEYKRTDLFTLLQLVLHGGDIGAQAQHLRFDPSILSLEFRDLGLQCVEILALATGGTATTRVTLTRTHRTPVSRTTGVHS